MAKKLSGTYAAVTHVSKKYFEQGIVLIRKVERSRSERENTIDRRRKWKANRLKTSKQYYIEDSIDKSVCEEI